MKNVMVAFEIKDPGEKPPDGFEEMAGRVVVIVRALYGLKSAGA